MQTDDLEKKKKLFFIDLGPSINYGEYDEISNLITPDYNQQSGDSPANAPPTPFSPYLRKWKHM
jgi:hypothetical protein